MATSTDLKKEYRNVKEYKHNKFLSAIYDADLWIDGKFIQHVTLDEVTFRYNVLIEKLNLMVKNRQIVDEETFKEVNEVMQLKYDEGADDVYRDHEH